MPLWPQISDENENPTILVQLNYHVCWVFIQCSINKVFLIFAISRFGFRTAEPDIKSTPHSIQYLRRGRTRLVSPLPCPTTFTSPPSTVQKELGWSRYTDIQKVSKTCILLYNVAKETLNQQEHFQGNSKLHTFQSRPITFYRAPKVPSPSASNPGGSWDLPFLWGTQDQGKPS